MTCTVTTNNNNGIIHCNSNSISYTLNYTNYTNYTTTTMLLINQVPLLPLQRKPLLGPGGIELTFSTDDDDSQMVPLSSPTPDSPTTCDTWSDASSSELAKSPRETATNLKCRAFACTQCPLSFHRNHDLRRHLRSVHGIERKSFVCRVCRVKSFPRPDSVRRHERTCRGLMSPVKNV